MYSELLLVHTQQDALIEQVTAYLFPFLHDYGITNTSSLLLPQEGLLLPALDKAVERSDLIVILADKIQFSAAKSLLIRALGYPSYKDPTLEAKLLERMSVQDYTQQQSHNIFPQNAILFPTETGLYSGFAVENEGQAIVFLPLDVASLKYMSYRSLRNFFKDFTHLFSASHTIGLFGISTAQLEQSLLAANLRKECTWSIADLSGELHLQITALANDQQEANRISNHVLHTLKQIFGKNIYAVDQPELVLLAFQELQRTDALCALVKNENLESFLQKAAQIEGYSRCLALLPGRKDSTQQAMSPKEYILKMAASARLTQNAELGAAMSDIIPETNLAGQEVNAIYIALADQKNLHVRKVSALREDNAEFLRASAAACLFELIYSTLRHEHASEVIAIPEGKRRPATSPGMRTLRWLLVTALLILLAFLVFFGVDYFLQTGYLHSYDAQILPFLPMG